MTKFNWFVDHWKINDDSYQLTDHTSDHNRSGVNCLVLYAWCEDHRIVPNSPPTIALPPKELLSKRPEPRISSSLMKQQVTETKFLFRLFGQFRQRYPVQSLLSLLFAEKYPCLLRPALQYSCFEGLINEYPNFLVIIKQSHFPPTLSSPCTFLQVFQDHL